MKELLIKLKQNGGEHILFVGATILTAGINFIYSIYVKAYVEPLEYGMYSTCILLQTYMSYLQLGSLNAFNRDYPQLVGAEKKEKANTYRNTVFSFLLIVYSIGLLVVATGIFFVDKYTDIDSRLSIGFTLSAVITIVTVIENYGNYRCRIDNGFKYSSMVTILELLSIPFGLVLVPRLGYYAIYITSIISMVIGIALYFKTSFKDFKFIIDRQLLRTILISGMPLLINGLIWTVVNSIDKFVILGFIDTEALGVYGIAQNAFSYMVLIPSAMSQLFYVKMGKEYGASGEVNCLIEVSIKFSTILATVTSVVALFAYFFLPALVSTYMPSYNNGVHASQILILGLSVYAATLVSGNILTILKENKALLTNSVLLCAFNLIVSICFVKVCGAKIESVALGTAVSYIFCAGIIMLQVRKITGCSIFRQLKATAFPVCISIVPGVLIYQVIESKIVGFIISFVIALGVFVCWNRTFIKNLKVKGI